MKIKRCLVAILIAVIFSACLFDQIGVTYAATAATPKYLRIQALMSDNPSFGYAIGKPGSGNESGSDQQTKTGAKIWNIVEMQSENSTSVKSEQNDIYCLREGIGFKLDTNQEYNTYYDMKTEKATISANVYDWNKTIDGVNAYSAILAVLDLFYVNGQSSDEYKAELLNNAGITINSESNPNGEFTIGITDTDIKAVQQAALWYFTNYGENTNGLYDKTGSSSWLNYTTDGNNYAPLSDYNLATYEGQQRNEQACLLYNYLIRTAKANASKFDNTSSENTKSPAIVDKTKKLKYEENGSNYIVGPIRINEQENNTTDYSIDFAVKNGTNAVSNYKLLKSDKTTNANNVKDLVGEDFYVSIPKSSISLDSLKIAINIKYDKTTINLWTKATAMNPVDTQPVVIPEKKQVEEPTELTVDGRIFDLSLRKYITAVNGVNLTGNSSRVPEIDTSNTLDKGETTASYKHKKDPVVVEEGDKVTYKLTIYNEGNKKGRATEIIDQLPTGVKFSKITNGNFDLGSYDESTNRLTLVRKSNNTDDLEAYTSGNLDSETIEIECEVTATADTKTNKVLTNVAWISKEYNSEDNVTIIEQDGADRDSKPSNSPNVNKDNMSDYKGNSNNKTDLADSEYYYEGQQDDDDFEKLVILPESFDLKLIKRITEVNGVGVPERIKSVDTSKLNTVDANGNTITTAEYKMEKDPIGVAKGDIITYTFRVYNEGTIDGYAEELTEDIPSGLEFMWSEKEGQELEEDTSLTAEEKEAIKFNQDHLWAYGDSSLKTISTTYLSSERTTDNLIKAFGKNDGTKTTFSEENYKEVSVKLRVVAEEITGSAIRNEACISKDSDKNRQEVDDRDSSPEEWKKEDDNKYYDDDEKWPSYKEDDEDYDNIILKSFDLALRKFIIAVSNDETIEDSEYLKNSDGSYMRAPQVDTSKLNTIGEDGKMITTAEYNHTKEPISLTRNDIVVYNLRVYNEGDIDGYASEIKDHLPEYLEFVEGSFNEKYGWNVSEDGRTVTTNYLKDSIIGKAEKDSDGKYVLKYKEVPIMCKVKPEVKSGEKITNIAEISEYLDENKKETTDRDSQKDNVNLPTDEDLPEYKDDESNKDYVPGQQDDDDFEKIVVKRFDLALRKFITKVDQKDVTTRIPQVNYDQSTNQITYVHTKEPVNVVTGNIVTYTIRVYNEGEINGYASLISDDIPNGLKFLPDNTTNKNNRWIMVDENGNETSDVTKAVRIQTDYLSKEQEKKSGDNLLKAFNPNEAITDSNPDYRDVLVAFEVVEPNTSDKILVNSAQISDDTDENGKPIDDDDSETDKWNEGEDDQDREYVKLNYFDLALRKWVTEAIVIENGETTVTKTGHQPYDDPEQIVKVELHRKKLDQVTVKFRYSIRIINEGDIEGYAKEITDYVPNGLKFVAEDNPGWTDEGNNVISTRLLENTLLKPGEYADVEVLLTWMNDENNMGVMNNTAEISEDYNEYGAKDIDSTPDNKKQGEDDIDDAPVMLSISTGELKTYFTLGVIILVTIAGGVILIKKYVL